MVASQRLGSTLRCVPLSIAPMVDCTDRHFRYLLRQITRRTLLYTEMIATRAALEADRAARNDPLRHLPMEHPLAIQFGGDDPDELSRCCELAEQSGFDEVNLNVGCPSDRVQQGRFGACLMAEPQRVARCVEAMKAATQLPVTVKHRIGIKDATSCLDRYEDMARFVRIVAAAGCDRFVVHARIALLHGLSPKQNRSVPPLRYDDVYHLKRELPELTIEINGGVMSLDQVADHLQQVDGVMIGRAAYDNPLLLAAADSRFFGAPAIAATSNDPRDVVEAMIPYIEQQRDEGTRPHAITRHMLGLFSGQRGARAWRRQLSEVARQPDADIARLLVAAMPTKE